MELVPRHGSDRAYFLGVVLIPTRANVGRASSTQEDADVPVRKVKLATARKHTHIIACSKSGAVDEQRPYESGRRAVALEVK